MGLGMIQTALGLTKVAEAGTISEGLFQKPQNDSEDYVSHPGRAKLIPDGLFRFIQMFLQIGHEGSAAGADCCGIGRAGLVLAIDVAVGVADVDLPKLGQ